MASDWAQTVQRAYKQGDGVLLGLCLDPLGNFPALQAELRSGKRPEKIVVPFADVDSASFSKFCLSLLVFLRDADPATPAKGFEVLDAGSLHAQETLKRSTTNWFLPALKNHLRVLVDLAKQADAVASDRLDPSARNRRTNAVSSRIFNFIGVCVDAGQTAPRGTKREAIMYLANTLYRIHFRIRSDMVQFDNINTRLNGMPGFLDHLDSYAKRDRVTYEYYRGRICLLQRRLTRAMHHLRLSFDMCPDSHANNRRRILYYLVVASLCRGRLPSAELLSRYDLLDDFAPVFRPLIKGDFHSCTAALHAVSARHLSMGTYFLLREKMEVICWRNLIRRVALLCPPPREGAPPTLTFRAIAAAARVAFREGDLDAVDAECICASLCEQRLVRGYVAHRQGVLVLSKSAPFPAMSHVDTTTPAA